MRHDDDWDKAGALAALALTPGKVSYKPLINYCRDLSAAIPRALTAIGNGAGDAARGDVLIHGLWERGTGCVLDTRVTDTDAKLYSRLSSSKVLENATKEKKDT